MPIRPVQYKHLPRIKSPSDIKGMTSLELEELALEIRRRIVEVVSVNGGHCAPSLGVVELTLALHLVFDTPKDKLVWDVGHQAYAHKLLTGRNAMFDTLRKKDGVCGYPKREESPHDAFNVGHGGTSISAALGMAVARDRLNGDENIVAIIGDGSFTAGMAYEALSHAGYLGKKLLIVLNDNKMSISPNTGAMSDYLHRLTTSKRYFQTRNLAHFLLRKIPAAGVPAINFLHRLKGVIKRILLPGTLFEELGCHYIGPIDGHNLEHMREIFQNIKIVKERPVVVHVVTQKGKGYRHAMENARRFHGLSPFDIETGEGLSKSSKETYSQVFGSYLTELAQRDKRIMAVTAAMEDGTGLKPFREALPEQFLDAAMAEQHAVALAAGMAAQGLIPVAAIYSTFLQRAYDQVVHDVAGQNLHVIFAMDRGGIVGDDGVTHQGLFDFSYLRAIPNMTVMAPKDENELRDMMLTALDAKGPIAYRYPRGSVPGVEPRPPRKLSIGKAELLREGEDVVLWAVGSMVLPALAAAEILEKEGVRAAVVNARFVKPVDKETLKKLTLKTKRLVAIEENAVQGGMGSGVLQALTELGVDDVRVRLHGVPDELVEHMSVPEALEKFGLTPQGIAAEARALVGTAPISRRQSHESSSAS